MAAADNATTGRGAAMTGVVLSVEAPGPTLVTQQAVPVATWVRNTAASPQLVPSPEGPSRYVFRLSQQTGMPSLPGVVELSEKSHAESLHDGTPAPVVPDALFNLGPGLRSRRTDDVVALLNRPLGPGVYEVLPLWPRDDGTVLQPAAAARFEVVAPRPAALSMAVCSTDQRRPFVFVQPQAAGGHTLLLQEAFPGGKALAVFRPVLSGAGPAGSVAISIKPAEAPGGRWVAWLRGQVLAARRVPSLLEPEPTPEVTLPASADGRLLSPGFTLADGSGLFVAVLRRSDDTPGLQVVRVHEGGAQTVGDLLRWATRSPRFPVLRYLDMGRGTGALQLVWDEGQTVMAQTFALQAGTVSPVAAAQPLGTLDDPIVGLSASALGNRQPAAVFVACSTAGHGVRVLRLRAPAATRPAPELDLPALAAAPRALALQGMRSGAAVAAAFPDRINYAMPGDKQWRTHECRSDAAFLRLTSIDGNTLWLEWLDPSHGFRIKRV